MYWISYETATGLRVERVGTKGEADEAAKLLRRLGRKAVRVRKGNPRNNPSTALKTPSGFGARGSYLGKSFATKTAAQKAAKRVKALGFNNVYITQDSIGYVVMMARTHKNPSALKIKSGQWVPAHAVRIVKGQLQILR